MYAASGNGTEGKKTETESPIGTYDEKIQREWYGQPNPNVSTRVSDGF